MTYADGKISSGVSNGFGHYLDGYKYLPADDNDPRTWGNIDPAYLRPYSEVTGWLPRCECGWVGIIAAVPGGVDGWREPSDEQEQLLMDQWRLHLREDVAPKVAA